MSVGVNLLLNLVELVASKLPADTFDIEILEMHHRYKVDAPSGTALSLGNSAASGRGTTIKESGKLSREGANDPRKEGEIGFATLRGGGIIGDHTVIFASENERIELTHKAQNRGVFANGAVRAAIWAEGKKPGLYDMKDVLGL
jgi:4-hydroxy-tetrahydrodipicolinate reductase